MASVALLVGGQRAEGAGEREREADPQDVLALGPQDGGERQGRSSDRGGCQE
jgi:hypothetical protein